jgi:hypothetical protein
MADMPVVSDHSGAVLFPLLAREQAVIAVVVSTMNKDARVTCRQTKSSLLCLARAVGLPIIYESFRHHVGWRVAQFLWFVQSLRMFDDAKRIDLWLK